MPDLIRVLLVDDQQLMREGLRTLLDLEPDLQVVGESKNGREALHAYIRYHPDVVLMDIRMPELDGVEATSAILEHDPHAKVIILTTFDDDRYVFDGIRAGALGYLLKDVSGGELASAIRIVVSGGVLIEPSVARKVVAEFSRLGGTMQRQSGILSEKLSSREMEILKFVADGMTNREISAKIHLAEGTVKNYITTILQKIQARDRTQAAIKGRELGLI